MSLPSLRSSSQSAQTSLPTHSTVGIGDWMSSGRIPMCLQIVQIPHMRTAAHCRRIPVLVYRVWPWFLSYSWWWMVHGFNRASLLRCNGCSNPAVTDSACHRTRTDLRPPSGMVSLESVCSPWAPFVVPTGAPGISSILRWATRYLRSSEASIQHHEHVAWFSQCRSDRCEVAEEFLHAVQGVSQWPLMTRGDDSSSTIASSSRMFQKS